MTAGVEAHDTKTPPGVGLSSTNPETLSSGIQYLFSIIKSTITFKVISDSIVSPTCKAKIDLFYLIFDHYQTLSDLRQYIVNIIAENIKMIWY